MKPVLLISALLLVVVAGCNSTGGGGTDGGSALRPVLAGGLWVHPETQLPYSGDFDNTVKGIRLKMRIRAGRPHGPMQRWYASSPQVFESLNFTRGLPDGPQIRWYPTGQKMMEANFRRGQLLSGTSWHLNGDVASTVANGNGTLTEFDTMGRKLGEKIYRNGRPVAAPPRTPPVRHDGLWVHPETKTPFTGEMNQVENGSRLKMEVKNGRPHGRLQSWYPVGNAPREDYYYVDGRRDGLQLSWYPNGRRMMQAEFALGQLLNALTWRLDGSRASAVSSGDGSLILFDAQGAQRKHSIYRDGRRVGIGK